MVLAVYFIISACIGIGLAISTINCENQTEKFVLWAIFSIFWPGLLFVLIGLLIGAGIKWAINY